MRTSVGSRKHSQTQTLSPFDTANKNMEWILKSVAVPGGGAEAMSAPPVLRKRWLSMVDTLLIPNYLEALIFLTIGLLCSVSLVSDSSGATEQPAIVNLWFDLNYVVHNVCRYYGGRGPSRRTRIARLNTHCTHKTQNTTQHNRATVKVSQSKRLTRFIQPLQNNVLAATTTLRKLRSLIFSKCLRAKPKLS